MTDLKPGLLRAAEIADKHAKIYVGCGYNNQADAARAVGCSIRQAASELPEPVEDWLCSQPGCDLWHSDHALPPTRKECEANRTPDSQSGETGTHTAQPPVNEPGALCEEAASRIEALEAELKNARETGANGHCFECDEPLVPWCPRCNAKEPK